MRGTEPPLRRFQVTHLIKSSGLRVRPRGVGRASETGECYEQRHYGRQLETAQR